MALIIHSNSDEQLTTGDWERAKRLAAKDAQALDAVEAELKVRINSLRPRVQEVDRQEELLLHVAAGLDPLTALATSAEDSDVEDYEAWKPYALVCVYILAGLALKYWISGS